jgi:hypothetical protein
MKLTFGSNMKHYLFGRPSRRNPIQKFKKRVKKEVICGMWWWEDGVVLTFQCTSFVLSNDNNIYTYQNFSSLFFAIY